MSDRALPRSYRAMEGFGVHTFRLINAEGVSRFVKFHWKPVAGAFSLVWDETLKIAGKDPDRSEEHTSELQSLMRISYAVFCLKKKKQTTRMQRIPPALI